MHAVILKGCFFDGVVWEGIQELNKGRALISKVGATILVSSVVTVPVEG